jgi:predicted transcriptional regulator
MSLRTPPAVSKIRQIVYVFIEMHKKTLITCEVVNQAKLTCKRHKCLHTNISGRSSNEMVQLLFILGLTVASGDISERLKINALRCSYPIKTNALKISNS